MADGKCKKSKNILMSVIGMTLLVLGITLILVWWPNFVMILKGSAGFVLALAGLFALYSIK